MKRAFTLIELIVVIVIMGILASIGAEIFTNMYKNYIQISNIHDLEAKTKNVSEIVAKRFEYSIRESVAATRQNPDSNDIKTMAIISVDDLNDSSDDPNIGLIWFSRDYDMEKDLTRSNFMRYSPSNGVIHVPNGAIRDSDRGYIFIIPDLINQYADFDTFYRNINTDNSLQSAVIADINSTGKTVDLNTTGSPFLSSSVSKFYLSDTIHRINTINPTEPTDAQGNNYLNGNGKNLRTYDLALFSCNSSGTNCTNTIIEKDISSFRFRRVGRGSLIIKICMVDKVLDYESGGRKYLYEICKTRVVQ